MHYNRCSELSGLIHSHSPKVPAWGKRTPDRLGVMGAKPAVTGEADHYLTNSFANHVVMGANKNPGYKNPG